MREMGWRASASGRVASAALVVACLLAPAAPLALEGGGGAGGAAAAQAGDRHARPRPQRRAACAPSPSPTDAGACRRRSPTSTRSSSKTLLAYEDRRFRDASRRRRAARSPAPPSSSSATAGPSPAPRRSPCRWRGCSKGDSTRSPAGKLDQMLTALALERTLSKDQILELYLTLAPYGGNIEGVRAASLAYFGKEPRRLTPAEAALLVALPQAPEGRRPDRNAARAEAARDRVLARAVDGRHPARGRRRRGADGGRAGGAPPVPDARRPYRRRAWSPRRRASRSTGSPSTPACSAAWNRSPPSAPPRSPIPSRSPSSSPTTRPARSSPRSAPPASSTSAATASST